MSRMCAARPPPTPLVSPALAVPAEPLAAARPTVPQALPRISSQLLMGAARELEIEHGDQLYRLRLTAQDKLILTK